jgi:aminopeptidase N
MRCLAALLFLAPLAAVPLPRDFSVEHYDVKLTPDIGAKTLTGEVAIRFHCTGVRLDGLELDAGALQVTGVTEGNAPLWFERKGSLLVVVLTKPALTGEHRTIVVRYRAGPAKGLVFFPDQVYTSFTTSDWMPCNDRPDDPAMLKLDIVVPPGMKLAATDHLDSPTPTFLYGFALGDFAESRRGRLRILAPATLQTGPVFDIAEAATQFLEGRTGQLYPLETYTQVFTHGTVEQEVAGGITLLPEKQAGDRWLIAHELAHQWYGVAIPTKDWSDFWLSEGIATFLADLFVGPHEIENSRKAYEELKAQGKDRPLSFADWETPREAGGRIPYQKGAWVLELLRRQLGDKIFWSGLQLYTKGYWHKTVTSADFQKAMEVASGKSLETFFAKWVY